MNFHPKKFVFGKNWSDSHNSMWKSEPTIFTNMGELFNTNINLH
jgi:hypothetical protein